MPTRRQQEIKDSFDTLRSLWNGEKVSERWNHGRERELKGNTLRESYGKSNEEFAKKMFNEIVYRATYKPALESFENFTEGDFRRISNEIVKENNRLKNTNINVLEKVFFVKRGTMAKTAVTNWMNKKINLATNYERTQYSTYLRDHMNISKILRAEIVREGGQSKFKPGVSSLREMEKLENELVVAMSMPKSQKIAHEIQEKYEKLMDLFKTGGGKVLGEFREYLEETPRFLRKGKGGELIKTDPKKSRPNVFKTNEKGEIVGEYSPLIVEAGKLARESLNNSGQVLINGMNKHRDVVKLVFTNGDALDPSNPAHKKVIKYRDKIGKEIESIQDRMKQGDYFPHYLLSSFINIENLMKKAEKEKAESLEPNKWDSQSILEQLSDEFSNARSNLGIVRAGKFRSQKGYEDYLRNPLGVLRQYSMDAITFNRVNNIRETYLTGIKHLPKDPEVAKGLKRYLDDVFTLAERGYQDRPSWVNKMVRTLTGYEFFSKIGFGVATAARNTLSGLYYMQSTGNFAFAKYMKDYNKYPKHLRKAVRDIEKEQGFLFEDMSSELFTEGLLPTEGVNAARDVDIRMINGKPQLAFRDGTGWKKFDSALTYATGKAAIFQKVTENYLRKHMFRYSFTDKYKELVDGGVKDGEAKGVARDHALNIVNKYAFEYAAHQKAPATGGTAHKAGSIGQIAFQFFHFPFSFLQMQSEILRKSKDAAMAKQWNSPDLYIPLKFGALFAFTTLMSGVLNVDFHTLMENDTVDRIKDIKDTVEGKEEVRGRGYIGPAVGDLYFLASLHDFNMMEDNRIKELIVGYNDAYKMTDEQKHSRLLSLINVEMSKWVTKDWKALQNGNLWNVMMHEFGLYPRAWTREMREKEPLKRVFTKPKKKGKKGKELRRQEELGKLYRAMGV